MGLDFGSRGPFGFIGQSISRVGLDGQRLR